MGKVYSSREVIQLLTADGWHEVSTTGSHLHFKHRQKPGILTVLHPQKHLGVALLHRIFKQAQLKEEKR